MFLISYIQKISILTKLILKCCGNLSNIAAVKLAKDFFYMLDELARENVDLKTLEEEFVALFPRHWQRRTEFLLIITEHLPAILSEMGKTDCHPVENIGLHRQNCVSKGISDEIDVRTIKNKINIFEAFDVFEEVEGIFQLAQRNMGKKIAVVSPDSNFSDLLYSRFFIEGEFVSVHFENFDRENLRSFFSGGKDFDEEFQKFLDEIECYFSDFDDLLHENFPRLVVVLLDFFQQEKKSARSVSIIKISDIRYCLDDILILSSLNESSWKINMTGEYWLHESLRKKLGLCSFDEARHFIADDFFSCFNNFSEVYLTRAVKTNGVLEYKSSILTKFEAMCKKNNITINHCHVPMECAIKNDLVPDQINILPQSLWAFDVQLLMRNEAGFYAKNVLDLSVVEPEFGKKDFYIFFKNLLYSYFKNDAKIDLWMGMIKTVDFFSYQKCKNILAWLLEHFGQTEGSKFVLNQTRFEAKLQIEERMGLNIFAYADRIENNSLIFYRNSPIVSSQNLKDEEGIMATCWVVANALQIQQKILFDEIQIWSIGSSFKEPIVVKKFEMTCEKIMAFEIRLKNAISAFLLNQKIMCHNKNQKYNKYKHFERI